MKEKKDIFIYLSNRSVVSLYHLNNTVTQKLQISFVEKIMLVGRQRQQNRKYEEEVKYIYRLLTKLRNTIVDNVVYHDLIMAEGW